MRSMVGTFLAAGVLLLGTAPLAIAKTDQEVLEAALKKHARQYFAQTKHRSVCVCLDGSPMNRRAGWLRYGMTNDAGAFGFQVSCVVESFNQAGEVIASSQCQQFDVIGK